MMTPLLEQYTGTRKLTPGQNRYKYPSSKMGMALITESVNECNFCELLEFDSRVKGFIAQPKSITYDLYQEGHLYTSDFLVEFYYITPTFYEIKPKNYIPSPEEQDKFDEIKKIFHSMGFNFLLVTAGFIDIGYRIENMKYLRRFRNITTPIEITDHIKNFLENSVHNQTSINCLKNGIIKKFHINEKLALQHIHICIANKTISFDIEMERIKGESLVGVWNDSFNRSWNAVPVK